MTIYINSSAASVRESDTREQYERRREKELARRKAERQAVRRQQVHVRHDAMQLALAAVARSEQKSLALKADRDERWVDRDARDAQQAAARVSTPEMGCMREERKALRSQLDAAHAESDVDLLAPQPEPQPQPKPQPKPDGSQDSEGDLAFIDGFFADPPASDDEMQQLSSSLTASSAAVRDRTDRDAQGPRAVAFTRPAVSRAPTTQTQSQPPEAYAPTTQRQSQLLEELAPPAQRQSQPPEALNADEKRAAEAPVARENLQSRPPEAMNERAAVAVSASDDTPATEDEARLAFLEAFCADSLASDEDTQRLSAALDQLSSAASVGALPTPAIQLAVLATHAGNTPSRKQGASAAVTTVHGSTASAEKEHPMTGLEETLMQACAMLSDQDQQKALFKKLVDERRMRAESSDRDLASSAMQANAEVLGALQAIHSRQAAITLPLETVRNV